MLTFDHPLGLFRLEHSPEWDAEYDAAAGSLTLRRGGPEGMTALNLLPLAITGATTAPGELLLQHAKRLGVWVPLEGVQPEFRERLEVARAEGRRPTLDESVAASFRFWVFTRDALSVVITQLGPGTDAPAAREAADAVLGSLRLPEVIPPTPAEFLTEVLKALRRDCPQWVGTIIGEWEVEVTDPDGAPIVTLPLSELYAETLRDPANADVLLKGYLARTLPAKEDEGGESLETTAPGR